MFVKQFSKWLFPSVMFKGYSKTINSQAVTVLQEDADELPLLVRFDSAAITDGGSGYGYGCKHIKYNGDGTTSIYQNEGSTTSCDFNLVETVAAVISGVAGDPGLVGGGTSGSVTLSRGLAVRNETGGTLVKGTLVYISGYANSNYLVSKADANGAATLATFVLSADLNNNSNGTAYGVQVVTGINTDGAAAIGSPLYLSETAGEFTATAPTNSNADVQIVGRVIVKHASTGSALFFPEYGIVSKIGSDHIQNQGVSGNALDAGAFTNGLTKNGSQVGVGCRVYNNTGGTLTPGTLVYLSGYDGVNGIAVAKADADAGLLATHVVTASINNAAFGYVYAVATVTGQNTGGRTIGDAVYLETTAGTYTFTAPTAANTAAQIVGRVVTVDGANGSIEFFPALRLVTAFSSTFLQNGAITAAKIAGGAVTPGHLAVGEAVTATADGTGTGLMSGDSAFITVTSGAATDQATLPDGTEVAFIGKTYRIWVDANGFELITPATSGATINGVDSDGTNQLDVPATTLLECTLVASNTWIVRGFDEAGAELATLVPDND